MNVKKEHLDMQICEFYNYVDEFLNTETFREYIQNTEKEFGLTPADLENMSDKKLNNYLDFLDDLWTK